MAFVVAGVLILGGAVMIVCRERFAADNADWQRSLVPQLSSLRAQKLSAFGFGIFGALIVLGGIALLAAALHSS